MFAWGEGGLTDVGWAWRRREEWWSQACEVSKYGMSKKRGSRVLMLDRLEARCLVGYCKGSCCFSVGFAKPYGCCHDKRADLEV